jgi:hypothetical protein
LEKRPTRPHEPIIASFNQGSALFYDIEQVEEFVAFMGAFEVDSFLDEKFDTLCYCP